MKICVTGGTGFIGKPLVRHLIKEGYEVVVLTRHSGQTIEGFQRQVCDLNNWKEAEAAFRRIRPWATIHLAWEGLPDYSESISAKNLSMGLNVYTAALDVGCHTVITTGSCLEYRKLCGLVTEESETTMSTPFPRAKNLLKQKGKALAEVYGVLFYWLRLFYVYGPGQRSTSLIPHIFHSVKNGTFPAVQNPWSINDYIFIDDAVRAIGAVLKIRPPRDVYNVAAGESVVVRDIVNYVTRIMVGKEMGIKEENNQVVDHYRVDISRIIADTGWRPTWNIQSGIRETLSLLTEGYS